MIASRCSKSTMIIHDLGSNPTRPDQLLCDRVTIDGVWIGNWIYGIVTVSRIYTFNKSLQHALGLSSLLCPHQLLPGNTPNTVDFSASVFHSSCRCELASISQQDSALLHKCLQQWAFLLPTSLLGVAVQWLLTDSSIVAWCRYWRGLQGKHWVTCCYHAVL
jgi:hypothetical protein